MSRQRCIRITALAALLVFVVLGHLSLHAYSAHGDAVQVRVPPLELISRGLSREKVAALTFDDGPDPRYTPRVLAILRAEKIRATFFQLGEFVGKYPDLTRQVAAEGHAIGNHGYSHSVMSLMTVDRASGEVDRTAEAIRGVTGRSPELLRPPKGVYSDLVFQLVRAKGYRMVLWTVTINPKAESTPEGKADWLLKQACPGMIILAHDGRLNRETTMKTLPIVIRGLKARGYRFVTIPELLEITEAERAGAERETAVKALHIDRQEPVSRRPAAHAGVLSRLLDDIRTEFISPTRRVRGKD